MGYILALVIGGIIVLLLWYRDKKCTEYESAAKIKAGKKCSECGIVHHNAGNYCDNCTRANALFDRAMEHEDKGEYEQAIELFAEAEKMGLLKAKTMYGIMLLGGMGTEQDIKKGVSYIETAADHGETVALMYMAECLAYGKLSPIIEKDEKRALSYMEQAAESGFDEAQMKLAKMYGNGIGGEVKNHLAVHWFEKASAQGNAEAKYMLGLAYAAGIGVERNMQLAIAFWIGAAEQGNQDAINELKELNL